MKVKILKGTKGMFGYSHHSGDRADLPEDVAKRMIEAGYAEADKEQKSETAESKAKPEHAAKFKK